MIKINEKFIEYTTHSNRGTSKYKVVKEDSNYVYFNDTLNNKLRYDKKKDNIEMFSNGKWDYYITDDLAQVDLTEGIMDEAFLHVSPELNNEIGQCFDRAHGNIHSFFKDLENTMEYFVSDGDNIKRKYAKEFIDSLERYVKEIRSSCKV